MKNKVQKLYTVFTYIHTYIQRTKHLYLYHSSNIPLTPKPSKILSHFSIINQKFPLCSRLTFPFSFREWPCPPRLRTIANVPETACVRTPLWEQHPSSSLGWPLGVRTICRKFTLMRLVIALSQFKGTAAVICVTIRLLVGPADRPSTLAVSYVVSEGFRDLLELGWLWLMFFFFF